MSTQSQENLTLDPAAPATPPAVGTSQPVSRGVSRSVAPNTDNSDLTTRYAELSQMLSLYNQVTENLRESHEALQAQVVRLQAQLANADAALQRSKRLAALGEMAAGIAHEIRNPLGAIQLYIGMLTEDLVSLQPHLTGQPADTLQGADQTARKIGAAVRGLNAIVGDVLSFARELVPQSRPLTASQIFDRVIETQLPALEQAGIQVYRNSEAEAACDVLADPDLMQQAMMNLVRNAIEAMTGSPLQGQRQLTLTARRDGSHVILRIADTGPGIPPEAIDRIFNPFFTTRNTGTGLGLAIVHRIVDVHGGTITVHHADGAAFELRLPAPPQGMNSPACENTNKLCGSRA